MSRVTNLMLSCSFHDHDDRTDEKPDAMCKALLAVRAWCNGEGREPDRDFIRFPAQVDTVSGGTRHMECNVYAWGANYLDLEAFLDVIAAAPWRQPDCVQVFAMEQDDDRFRMYNLDEKGHWKIWPPAA